MKRLTIWFLLLALWCAVPFAARATTSVTDVARELVCDCPDCGKQTLDQCPTCETGQKYRAVIAQQLQKGQDKFQVINYFADNYGEHMLGSPRAQGFGRLAMILPPLALALGLIPVALALRSRRSSHRSSSVPKAEVTPKTEDPRVAQALRDFDF